MMRQEIIISCDKDRGTVMRCMADVRFEESDFVTAWRVALDAGWIATEDGHMCPAHHFNPIALGSDR